MNKVEILHKVNRLVVAGVRKSAIDMVQESLENINAYCNEATPDNTVEAITKEIPNTHTTLSLSNRFFANHDISTPITSSECWQFDLSKNEEEVSIDEFVIDEEEYSVIVPEIEDALTEIELIWSNLDEFDEINDPDNTNLHFINEVETTGQLNRFEKAKQIATEVVQTHAWGKENISLLEQVFLENGWGMARVSIEKELNQGLIPEELELALFIRQLWAENPQFWISFMHITSDRPGQETRASYKKMSWPESFRIIRSFNNIPSEEELQLFIYQIYDDWYCSTALQRQYKAFFKYVKYCTSLGPGSLPGNEIFSFVDSFYQESLCSGYDFI